MWLHCIEEGRQLISFLHTFGAPNGFVLTGFLPPDVCEGGWGLLPFLNPDVTPPPWSHSVIHIPLAGAHACVRKKTRYVRLTCRFQKAPARTTQIVIFHQHYPAFPSIFEHLSHLSIPGTEQIYLLSKESTKFTMNVSNGSQAQRPNFRHPFMMNTSYSHPSQDDMTEGLDPMDCDFLFECLGNVNSEMVQTTTQPTINHGRNVRSPTKKSTRISSTPKEKSSATPRASRVASSSSSMATFPLPSSYDDDERSMDDCESEKQESSKLSAKDMKNNQLEASKDRRRYVYELSFFFKKSFLSLTCCDFVSVCFFFVRERNKVLARKTRCKKKAEFEFLRKQLLKLQGENERLKDMVKGSLPSPFSAQVLLNCDVELPEHIANVVQDLIKTIEGSDPRLLIHPSRVGGQGFLRSFCVSNPSAPDCPIVYCSPGFSELTGRLSFLVVPPPPWYLMNTHSLTHSLLSNYLSYRIRHACHCGS